MDEVRRLAQQLASDPVRHANNAAHLLAFVKASNPKEVVLPAITALETYFLDFLESWSNDAKQRLEATALFHEWCTKQFANFTAALLALLEAFTDSAAVQVTALSVLMEAVRVQPIGKFCNIVFAQIVHALVSAAGMHAQVYSLFFSKFLPCADVRYYTLHTLTRIATDSATSSRGEQPSGSEKQLEQGREEPAGGPSTASSCCPPEDVARNMYDILAHVEARWNSEDSGMKSWCLAAEAGAVKAARTAHLSAKARRKKRKVEQQVPVITRPGPGANQEAAAWANAAMQKKAFSDAWLAFLRNPIPDDIYRKVLTHIHSTVIPNMTNPLLLSDFLTSALDKGGLLGMLALNGIFLLVTQHGLEYPQFYACLYGLLKEDVFLSKYRAQFFQLVEVFLASPLVPAYTAASFAKKLARLALTAPPAGAMTAIGFIHNLIRRHPACMVMLHKPSNTQKGSTPAGEDVFDAEAIDPACTRAVESSLWELVALRNHYAPQVSALTSILNKDLTNRVRTSEVELEPLLAASYSSLISETVDRKLKHVAVAFYQQPPSKLFDLNCTEDFAGWAVEPEAVTS